MRTENLLHLSSAIVTHIHHIEFDIHSLGSQLLSGQKYALVKLDKLELSIALLAALLDVKFRGANLVYLVQM